jgi:hypothetical protein
VKGKREGEKVEILKNTELFAGMSEEDLGVIAEHSVFLSCEDGEVLFKEGDPGREPVFGKKPPSRRDLHKRRKSMIMDIKPRVELFQNGDFEKILRGV